MRIHEVEEVVTTESGARASACHDYTGIPLSALDALAKRQELGATKHGRDNYRKGLGDPGYIRARLSHIIRHAITLAAKMDGREAWGADDDIGAMLWGGMFMAEARKHSPELFGEQVSAGGVVELQPSYYLPSPLNEVVNNNCPCVINSVKPPEVTEEVKPIEWVIKQLDKGETCQVIHLPTPELKEVEVSHFEPGKKYRSTVQPGGVYQYEGYEVGRGYTFRREGMSWTTENINEAIARFVSEPDEAA